ncbi:MAG: hypothetical protein ABEH77_05795 [Halobacteriaceae archaeon]
MAHPPADDDATLPDRPGDPAPSVEAYEAEEGVVLYDADNPIAWLKGSHATTLEECR